MEEKRKLIKVVFLKDRNIEIRQEFVFKEKKEEKSEDIGVGKDLQRKNENGGLSKEEPSTSKSGERQRPYQCAECSRQFLSVGTLESHVKYMLSMGHHSMKKPFQCTVCKVNFSEAASLKDHAIRHSPYGCEICQIKFERSTFLRNHMNIHTGERPYKCELCGGRFCWFSGLLRHKKMIHKITIIE